MVRFSVATVSIILPVKGSSVHLPLAIKSILVQTFKDWELIVCHDGDGHYMEFLNQTKKLLKNKLKLIDTKGNNLAKSLNIAISTSQGDYLARLDADDIMTHDRLEQQVSLLEKDDNLIVAGGQVITIDERDKIVKNSMRYSTSNEDLKANLLNKVPFAHPTVLMRKSIIESVGCYDQRMQFAEDYDLWLRLSPLGEFTNLASPILGYRIHSNQTSYNRAIDTLFYMIFGLINFVHQDTSNSDESVSIASIKSRIASLSDRDIRKVLFFLGRKVFLPDFRSIFWQTQPSDKLLFFLHAVLRSFQITRGNLRLTIQNSRSSKLTSGFLTYIEYLNQASIESVYELEIVK